MGDVEERFDPAELTDADLEAVAAGKYIAADALFVAPMVGFGLAPKSAFMSRTFRRGWRSAE
jgi:hypothetical protein